MMDAIRFTGLGRLVALGAVAAAAAAAAAMGSCC